LSLSDYHIHSTFSADGCDSIDQICEQAINTGLEEICITDHFDFEPEDLAYHQLDAKQYIAAIQSARSRYPSLSIRIGGEFCYQSSRKHEIAEKVRTTPLDFVLGSVHYVDGRLLLPSQCAASPVRVWARYIEEATSLAGAGLFDVMAHLDLPKRYMPASCRVAPEAFIPVLQNLVETGTGIEINASGFRSGLGEPLPSLALLKMYRSMGGEVVTVGSDAHRAKHVGSYIKDCLELAKAAGFTHYARFVERRIQWVKIE